MIYKALLNFTGVISMSKNEIRDLSSVNETIVKDLVEAKFIEKVKQNDEHKSKTKNK